VTHALLDYREICALIGPLDAKSFVAGYRDHGRWRIGELNPDRAGVALIERVRSLRSKRAS
jgi:hypothetical protein